MSTVIRITTSALLDGQVVQNVFHLEDPSETAVLSAVCDAVQTHWLTHIRAFQHTGCVWFDIEARLVSPSGPAAVHKTVTLPGTGPAEGDQDVPFAARVIQFQTATAGRHGRGRLFIPGTSFQAWTKGVIKPTSITSGVPLIDALENAWVGPLATTNLFLVIARRSDPSNFIRVTNIVQRTRLGSMRSRGIGIGV